MSDSTVCPKCGMMNGHDGGCPDSTMGRIVATGGCYDFEPSERYLLKQIIELLIDIRNRMIKPL